jgi:hypothetical protein
MTAHMHVCSKVGAVNVMDVNRYVIEMGAADDEEARNFVSFIIFPNDEIAVLPERLLHKSPCATKNCDTVQLIQDICRKQVFNPGGSTFRRLYRVVDADRERQIGPANLTKLEILLEPLFDLNDNFEPIPCKR